MNAQRIKSLRRRLGLTQGAFALRLGLASRSAVCHLERGSKQAKGPLRELLKVLEERHVHPR
jgi:DNA-binding transcriptional regulator YiaG